MEMLSEFIVVTVMAICFGIGHVIKYFLDFIPNKYIPLIMGAFRSFIEYMVEWIYGLLPKFY